MCITIPQKIVKLEKNKVITEKGETLDASLVSASAGDWVLTQNNFAITKISAKQAKNILNLISKNF